jgi:molecular chaperone DnaK (HSP70)
LLYDLGGGTFDICSWIRDGVLKYCLQMEILT